MKITRDIVQELLHYDPETGDFTWKERGEHWFKTKRSHKAWNSNFAGKKAGSEWICPNTGYKRRRIAVLGVTCKEHRLAWLYMNGAPIPDQIDHRNQDATDNRWENLRASSDAENRLNMSMRKDNTSGITGVRWHKAAKKWCAGCKFRRVNHHLGLFDEIDMAVMAVMEFRAEHGFDPRHGIEIAHYHRGVAA